MGTTMILSREITIHFPLDSKIIGSLPLRRRGLVALHVCSTFQFLNSFVLFLDVQDYQ